MIRIVYVWKILYLTTLALIGFVPMFMASIIVAIFHGPKWGIDTFLMEYRVMINVLRETFYVICYGKKPEKPMKLW